jgi:hypothetical protein
MSRSKPHFVRGEVVRKNMFFDVFRFAEFEVFQNTMSFEEAYSMLEL